MLERKRSRCLEDKLNKLYREEGRVSTFNSEGKGKGKKGKVVSDLGRKKGGRKEG